MFYRPEDLHLQKFLTTSHPPEAALKEVADTLSEQDEPLNKRELADAVEGSAAKRTRAVNLLEQAGAVGTTDDGRPTYREPDLTPGGSGR